MALNRQRILGELDSVMKQLQSADCGCLGKIFDSPQNTSMGGSFPPCGGCRRACCYSNDFCNYNSPGFMNQHPQNMNSMPMNATNPDQPMSGNMFGHGPQIVNMMRGGNAKPFNQNMPGQGQGQLTGPMLIDAPQSPHGQVGLTPFSLPGMSQQRQFDPSSMNQGNISGQIQNQFMSPPNPHATGHMQNQFMPQANPQAAGNMQNQFMSQPIPQAAGNMQNQFMSQPNPQAVGQMQNQPMSQPNPQAAGQMQNQPMSQPNSQVVGQMQNAAPWPQQNLTNPAANQMPMSHGNSLGPHAQGIAKFNQMFPGIQHGMGGDLGFDPMAIAIQMNPQNKMQSAIDTMNKVMNDNQGISKMFNSSPLAQPVTPSQLVNAGAPPNSQVPNNTTQQNLAPGQVVQNNDNQIANQQITAQNPNQLAHTPQNAANTYGQPIPQQNQQIYAVNNETNLTNQNAVQNEDRRTLNDKQENQQMNQYGQQQILDPNAHVSKLPGTIEESPEENQPELTPEQQKQYYYEMQRQEALREPIFPADPSMRHTYVPSRRERNYGYNTLGQPVQMVPAKLFHSAEPSLPQTLSPQSTPEKPRTNPLQAINVKGTVSKTSLMGKKPIGRTPSRNQLQQIYNQYKGSQSYTQQNVRQPGEATYSDGHLNVTQNNPTRTPMAPVERVGGDTVVSNPPVKQLQMNKVGKGMEQIGDVPAAAPSDPVKEAPVVTKNSRNGLQDVVFSTYPTSTAWTFHGHGRNELLPINHYRGRY